MPTEIGKDNNPLIGPSTRLARPAKKKPAKKTGAMGAPKKKAVKRKPARKASKKR